LRAASSERRKPPAKPQYKAARDRTLRATVR
jgi:hypothetical protein